MQRSPTRPADCSLENVAAGQQVKKARIEEAVDHLSAVSQTGQAASGGVWSVGLSITRYSVLAVALGRLATVSISRFDVPETSQARLLCVLDGEGRVLPAFSPVTQDLLIQAVAFGPMPDGASRGHPPIKQVHQDSTLLARAVRLELLSKQGPWLADDQIDAALRCIGSLAGQPGQQFRVMPSAPLAHALADATSQSVQRFRHELSQHVLILAGLYAEGHWIALAWKATGGQVLAWASLPMTIHTGPLVAAVAAANHFIARVLDMPVTAFSFRGGPMRNLLPGMCGAFALADLQAYLHDLPPMSEESALEFSAFALAAHQLQLEQGDVAMVQAPLLFGGALEVQAGAQAIPPLLEHGLTALLRAKGVPADVVATRVQQAAQRLGRFPLQRALQSSNQWRDLKHACNNVQPSPI